VSNFCSHADTVPFYGRIMLKVNEIQLGKKLGFAGNLWLANKKRVHNPVGDFEILFVRYVSSPFVFLLLL